jgi:flagellar biosynthetic protein FliP
MKQIKKKVVLLSLMLGFLFLSVTLSLASPIFSSADAHTKPTEPTKVPNQSASKDVADSKHDINNGLSISYNNDNGELSGTVRILIVLTVLSLAPSILIMLTSFTRIIVVLHFLRQALGTQTAPPNQVLIGLALFLTVFIMSPVFNQINEKAIKPFDEGKISQEKAIEIGTAPIRHFMYGETQEKDLALLCDISKVDVPTNEEQYNKISMTLVVPAFILSELRTAFIMGFCIYVPFIVIDMVVSSILMSMGMMMLPPTTISMPFKILLFILVDGWDLVIGAIVKTFM